MPAEFGPSTQFAVLEEKISSLRRQLITITVMGVLLMAALIAFQARGRSSPGPGAGTIEAQRFVVRDAQGRARAVLQSLESNGAQLVFFREPLAGDRWRSQVMPGPFAFGVRDWRGNPQLVLTNAEGAQVALMPNSLALSRSDRGLVLIELPPVAGGRIILADTSGTRTTLSAATMRASGASAGRR